MSRFFRFQPRRTARRLLRSELGASLVGYGLVVALVAAMAIAAVTGMGVRVQELFGAIVEQLFEDPSAPIVTLDITGTPAETGFALNFTWTTSGAATIAASYTATGACAAAQPGTLPWSSLSGSGAIAWSQELAGCAIEVCIEASNQEETANACASGAFAPLDTTPDLTFQPRLNAEPDSDIQSGPETISGVQGSIPVLAAGGTFKIGDGAWTTSGTAVAGDVVTLRLRTSTSFSTPTAMILQAGALTANWTVTTRAPDQLPELGSFGAAGVGPDGIEIPSPNAPAITGFEGTLSFTVANGLAAINGSPLHVQSGQVSPNDTIRLYGAPDPRDASGNPTAKQVQITFVGAVTGETTSFSWTVQTSAQDRLPNDLTPWPGTLTNLDPFKWQRAGPLQLTGFDAPISANITSSTPGNGYVSKDGIAWYPSIANLSPGDQLYVRNRPGTNTEDFGSPANTVTLNVGTLTKTWSISAYPVSVINTVNFSPFLAASPSTVVPSNGVTITGFTGTRTITPLTPGTQFMIGNPPGAPVNGPLTVGPGTVIRLLNTSLPIDTQGGTAAHKIVTIRVSDGVNFRDFSWDIYTQQP